MADKKDKKARIDRLAELLSDEHLDQRILKMTDGENEEFDEFLGGVEKDMDATDVEMKTPTMQDMVDVPGLRSSIEASGKTLDALYKPTASR